MGNSLGMTKTYAAEKEPCRVDLRVKSCFPYPPAEHQGSSVSCVCHAFALALYCISCESNNQVYPSMDQIFLEALRASPDKNKGVAFDQVASGAARVYNDVLLASGKRIKQLSNDSFAVREALRSGSPVIIGYQVDEKIDRFHKDIEICRNQGYLLPHFDPYAPYVTGHAVVILGYDFTVLSFIARNSWGLSWGVDGHFLIPYARIDDRQAVTDIWSIV